MHVVDVATASPGSQRSPASSSMKPSPQAFTGAVGLVSSPASAASAPFRGESSGRHAKNRPASAPSAIIARALRVIERIGYDDFGMAAAAPLAQKYRSLFVIGRGGMGSVEAAVQLEGERVVALKRLLPDAARD